MKASEGEDLSLLLQPPKSVQILNDKPVYRGKRAGADIFHTGSSHSCTQLRFSRGTELKEGAD